MRQLTTDESLAERVRSIAESAVSSGRTIEHLELTLMLNPGFRGDISPAAVYRALHAVGFTLDANGVVVRVA
jgi:hypothetical protein